MEIKYLTTLIKQIILSSLVSMTLDLFTQDISMLTGSHYSLRLSHLYTIMSCPYVDFLFEEGQVLFINLNLTDDQVDRKVKERKK